MSLLVGEQYCQDAVEFKINLFSKIQTLNYQA
jgi:hypothetical protein